MSVDAKRGVTVADETASAMRRNNGLDDLAFRLLEKAERDEDSDGPVERKCALRLQRQGFLQTEDAATFANRDALSLWLTDKGRARLERRRSLSRQGDT